MTAKAAGRGTILLLAAVAALGSLATQLLVPALPQVAHDLQVGPGPAQLVISVFLVGLGAGQLLTGPLTDRLGRKPVLLAGLLIYCAGSLAAALAPSLPLLLGARALQALGGATGVVTARVLVGDLFPPHETAGRQATLMAVVLISPALAPVIGGTLSELVGWRWLFGGLAAAGLAGLAIAVPGLPSPEAGGSSSRLVTHGFLASLPSVRRFLGPVAALAGGSTALYMFLGTAPFLLAHDYGLRPREVGAAMMIVAAASIGGTFLVARIERRGDALLVGTACGLIAGTTLLAFAAAGAPALAAFLGPIVVLGLGAGLIGPAGITRVIRAAPGREGTGTSLAGATQMLASALGASLLGHYAPVAAGSLGLAIALSTSIAVIGAFMSRTPSPM